MESKIFLNVNGEEKNISDISYDDLISLCNQYKDSVGKTPSRKDFKSSNNLPHYSVVERILLENNKTVLDFRIDIGETSTKSLNRYMNEEQRNQQFFPFTLKNGLILYYDKSDDPNSYSMQNVHLHDQYGYRYYTTRRNIQHLYKFNCEPRRFRFEDKTYLEYNINLHLELNNSIYRVYHIDDKANWNDKIQLISKYGDIIETDFQQIRNFSKKLTEEGHIHYLNRQVALNITKEDATKTIRKMQADLGRPLRKYDFNVETSDDSISIHTINKLWGSFSKMIDELGFDKGDLTTSDYIEYINSTCNYVKSQGRDVVSIADFKPEFCKVTYKIIHRHLLEENISVKDIVENNGLSFQKEGVLYNFIFEDGEKCLSYHEYEFSSILREYGLEYNVDYYKEIPYRIIDNEYFGNMKCDYKLICNGRIKFIELAGFLSERKHIDAYLRNKHIDISAKENYKDKLYAKEALFIKNDLDYEIIVKPWLNTEYYKQIVEMFYFSSYKGGDANELDTV